MKPTKQTREDHWLHDGVAFRRRLRDVNLVRQSGYHLILFVERTMLPFETDETGETDVETRC